MDISTAIEMVKASGSYKLLQKLVIDNHPHIGSMHACSNPSSGACLDTETTGFTHGTDKIIELGIVTYEYNPETGGIIRILDRYNGFEDPGHPLSQDVIKVTGITDSQLNGQTIDNAKVEAMLAPADVIVCHNAAFDRPFVEDRFPSTRRKAFACSMSQIDWAKEFITSRSLEYLLYKCGSWFIDAHRALNDAEGLLGLLAEQLPDSGVNVNATMLAKAFSVDTRIFAVGAPYDFKDDLKNRSYRWNDGSDGRPKAWWIDVPGDGSNELGWLSANIYKPGADRQIVVEHVDATTRFSKRG
ncbi:DNA polymerase III subunit epsilon (plasmid) [Trichlorobacter lovleyi]|uniref:3'-5' exonuclease n=1 Tax=Trichlorobacter lovleyi TaxID=313985 RepID=UPI00223EC026|nr:3'-5' exonuclease [Trichlorobacter lovleyi]QOX80832.1 DNA polymerase III subunit epsilon [Trichlorobacter lovleyi]